jgi:hypothetical protein
VKQRPYAPSATIALVDILRFTKKQRRIIYPIEDRTIKPLLLACSLTPSAAADWMQHLERLGH